MGGPNIFEFSNFRDYLHAHRGRKQPRFALEPWSKRLGYRSPRSVAMVLKGLRLPSSEMVLRLSHDLRLSKSETTYFGLLVSLEKNRKTGRGLEPILSALDQIQPKIPNQTFVDFGAFASISRWYCLVIKQLIGTPGFQESATWIRGRLRNKVSLLDIQRAIEILLKLGVIQRTKSGKLQVSKTHLTTSQDVPSSAIRSHLRQMLQRASEAVEEQDVDSREFTSITFKMKPERIVEVKKCIREFRDSLNKEFSCEDADGVWQLNLQLFQHTKEISS